MSTRPPSHHPGYKNMLNSKTYTAPAKCSNCGHGQSVEIEKGVRAETVIGVFVCDNCGCQTLEVDK